MRKPVQSITLLFAVLFLAGCNDFVSIYPLYDEFTLVSTPSLAGTWKSTEDDSWTFVPSEGRLYEVTLSSPEDEENWNLEGGLVELSGKLFLDLCGDDAGATGAPAHIFARIRIEESPLEGKRIEVAWLEQSWMEEQLRQEAHLTSLPPAHGRTILTTPTRDLQDFFRRHAWDEDAFSTSFK